MARCIGSLARSRSGTRRGPSYTFTIDFYEGFDAVPAAELLRFLFIFAPEGACAVTFQVEAVDMADFIAGLSFR